MLNAVLVDDEVDARSSLRTLLNKFFPNIEIIGEANGIQTGMQLIRKEQPQLVFLDIKMQDGTGFQLLDQFPKPDFRVVFVTAFDDFALKAFKYNALHYLLKPIDPDEFQQTIKTACQFIVKDLYHQQLTNLLENSRSNKFDKLALPTSEGLVFLKLEEIIYLQSEGNYTFFFTISGERIMVSKTIKNYEEILPSDTFYRIHQSYILNVKFIKKYLKEDGGLVLLDSGQKLPLSRRKKEGLLNMLTS